MLKTYDPKKILISLGSHTVTGYSDGTFVSIEANGDGISKKVGCDGEVVRSIDPDSSAKVTLTLLQTSPTVAYCQAQYEKDKATADGTFPLLVKDLKGGMVFSAKDAWVVKPPNREYGKEPTDREISIDCGEATTEGEKA
jgi:DNA-binding protein YbaB